MCPAMNLPPSASRRSRRAPRVLSCGYTIRGPDFYVWDEERAAAESWARELLRGSPAPRPVRPRRSAPRT